MASTPVPSPPDKICRTTGQPVSISLNIRPPRNNFKDSTSILHPGLDTECKVYSLFIRTGGRVGARRATCSVTSLRAEKFTSQVAGLSRQRSEGETCKREFLWSDTHAPFIFHVHR